jgi:hypothetical protein
MGASLATAMTAMDTSTHICVCVMGGSVTEPQRPMIFFLCGHMSASGEIKSGDEPVQRDELAVKAKASPQVRPRSA